MNDSSTRPNNRRRFLATTMATALAAGVMSTTTLATEKTKRIGFVDDDLENFHSKTYLRILRAELKDRGFTVTGATALQAAKGRKWADEHEVAYFDSADRLNDEVDFFAILAPSTPQTHWELCQKVFPLGKTTVVDKTFAPDPVTAQKIFELADKHNIAVQTSSALRYTPVQKYVTEQGRDTLQHMISWGGGSNFDEYVIHPLELVISCMGPDVETMMRRGRDPYSQLLLNFSNGRTAVVNVVTKGRTSFAASLTTAKETTYIPVESSQLFVDAAAGFLDFFEAGKALIDRRETMSVMRVIAAARNPAAGERFITI